MISKNKTYTRRDFFKKAGTAGAGAIIAPGILNAADTEDPNQEKPTPFRHDRLEKPVYLFPSFPLGEVSTFPTNQIIVNVAAKWGITYWDTAHRLRRRPQRNRYRQVYNK